ncbi:MAG: hypothetical protein KAI22_01990 [Gammaproteobacteria bacterium]|nr:hypothetical protein [Gammaproteobacteria bacterium]
MADGSFIDKVYHPYVQPHEKEIEWRWNIQKDSGNTEKERLRDNAQKHRLAYGQSINDRWFAEIYLVGEKNREQEFKLTAVEIEALWQITEQGEYDQDWGMLFEIEHERDSDVSEVSSALLIEKQWNKWVGTANLYLIYEWGSKIDNELETAMALQGKYRYSKLIEPAIEYYSSDASEGIGPVLLGSIKLSGRKKINWEAGVIFGLDNDTADQTIKFLLEFEF